MTTGMPHFPLISSLAVFNFCLTALLLTIFVFFIYLSFFSQVFLKEIAFGANQHIKLLGDSTFFSVLQLLVVLVFVDFLAFCAFINVSVSTLT